MFVKGTNKKVQREANEPIILHKTKYQLKVYIFRLVFIYPYVIVANLVSAFLFSLIFSMHILYLSFLQVHTAQILNSERIGNLGHHGECTILNFLIPNK